MKSTSLKILYLLISIDLLLLAGSILFFDVKIIYNTQIGFISSALVMVASLLSYRRMVRTRVEHNIITMDDSKDVIDTIEDPYDLYSEAVILDEEKDLAETVEEENKRLKEDKRSLYQTIKDAKAALSFYRLGAYAVLILGFLYLNRHGLLHVPSYILALSIPPMVIVLMLIKDKANHSQD